jgi:hypothetical protein
MGRRDTARLFTHLMIGIPLLGALGVVVWITVFAQPPGERMAERFKVRTGAPVPHVQLEDRAGAATSLSKIAGGAPALVVLADVECQFCENQMRTLRAMKDQGVPRVVAVSVSKPGGYATLAARYGWLSFYDDVNGAFRGKLGLEGVPVTLAVAADGTVRDVKFGLQNGLQLRALMDAASAPGLPAPAGAATAAR